MKILRTIIWVLALLGFLIFSIYNWKPVEVTLWQNLVMETKLPVLALLAFALGFVPLLTYHLSVKWGLNRRVRALENSLKTAALARQNDAQTPAAVVDRPVDNSGMKAGQPADPLSPTDSGSDGVTK
ncbi:DUF1049 domain-containing protein [Erythrobacter sp.]|uniref:DUF1049 domain-containing protein n=1 Tax=Erythrobacter sp. TaxID=1042 RepID=UPI0025FB1B96|nr:DUF1049 domain-containing protein [Erythrobacter sp.]